MQLCGYDVACHRYQAGGAPIRWAWSPLRETAGLVTGCTPGPCRIDALFLSILSCQLGSQPMPYSALGSCRPCTRHQKRDALISILRDERAVAGTLPLTVLHRHCRRSFAAYLFRSNTRCGSGGRHRDGSIARVQPDRRRRRGLLLGRLGISPARNRRAPSYALTAHRILTGRAAAFRAGRERKHRGHSQLDYKGKLFNHLPLLSPPPTEEMPINSGRPWESHSCCKTSCTSWRRP